MSRLLSLANVQPILTEAQRVFAELRLRTQRLFPIPTNPSGRVDASEELLADRGAAPGAARLSPVLATASLRSSLSFHVESKR